MTLTYGSVCSGIEAASVAWEPMGYAPLWFSEIEKFPSELLKYHYPNVPNLGDMTLIAKAIREGLTPAPDVLVGGTPCQAFSVAGLRGGLSDARGQLTLSYVDLLNAIDEKRNTPAIAVWENVPGVLSSKDNAFGCFLAGLAGESEPLQPTGKRWANAGYIIGPSRRIAWRILDAQYFGVAQRRRRLFVVASARDDFNPLECLFEFDSMRRDTPPSRKTGEEIAAFTPSSFGGYRQGLGTLRAQGGDLGGGSENLITVYGLQFCDANGRRKDRPNGGLYVTRPEVSHALTLTESPIKILHNEQLKIRKLLPVECERLQGFPDNYTNIPKAKDGPRYKALGNSMAVPVMRWIGVRVLLHHLGIAK